jgi:hypothetical protein
MPRELLMRKWTEEDDTKLRLFWPQALHVKGIAKRMGRNEGTVRRKAKVLGLPPKTSSSVRPFRMPSAERV